MATTYDYVQTTTDKVYGVGFPALSQGRIYQMERSVNIADACTEFGVTAFAANDVLKCFNIAADTLVLGVYMKVTTVSAVLADIEVGDGDNPDGYIDGATGASLGWNAGAATQGSSLQVDTAPNAAFSLPVGGGKLYTTADTIDFKMVTASAADGVFRIIVICMDLS